MILCEHEIHTHIQRERERQRQRQTDRQTEGEVAIACVYVKLSDRKLEKESLFVVESNLRNETKSM
jgi:hypothetical protein